MRRLATLRRIVTHHVPPQLLIQAALPDVLADYLAHDDDPEVRQITVTIGDGSRRQATRDHIITVQGTVADNDQPPADEWPP